MTLTLVRFTVLGTPQPAGSTRSFAIRHQGVFTGRVATTDSNPKTRTWEQSVAGEALAAYNAAGYNGLRRDPILVDTTFHLARPTGHYGTGRNAGRVRGAARPQPTVKPDLDKLVRGILDALTSTIWHDDSQVVTVIARKLYADNEPERAEIAVVALDP